MTVDTLMMYLLEMRKEEQALTCTWLFIILPLYYYSPCLLFYKQQL